VPVCFSFGLGALFYGISSGTDISFHAAYGYSQIGAFSLLALPLFVQAGTLMGTGGISERLLDFVDAFVGRTKGGLGAVTVLSCAMFGAISGSASAAIAAIGRIMGPRMVTSGYPEGHPTALGAGSSVLCFDDTPQHTYDRVCNCHPSVRRESLSGDDAARYFAGACVLCPELLFPAEKYQYSGVTEVTHARSW